MKWKTWGKVARVKVLSGNPGEWAAVEDNQLHSALAP